MTRGLFGRFRVDAFVENGKVVAVLDARSPGGPLVEAVPDAAGFWRAHFANARPLRWHDPLFARLVVTRRFVTPGEVPPPWYFALGYVDVVKGEAVFFFLGVALLVRALRWAEFLWNRARCRPSWFDRQLLEARHGRRP